ncbi:Uncharacterised protein [Mycobacteroides abscessus subsp. abscessus]|uniref:hypothetical protein n=1 Tax=Mycobacteroides abscessus TaxID=36809 RepID=UPI00092CD346|nr:hypothetical protein [Mycobacteroides abscessus]SIJ04871.1 Uncharacterised protein [Mycobacteroides abscessus subsp. abscessus]SIN15851.1 Uncharacterised protein [Mycobacteroides abscessus subsp. abscessus]
MTGDIATSIDQFRGDLTRLMLMKSVLTCAREGVLSPQWRQELPAAVASAQGQSSGECMNTAAVSAVAAIAPAAWEPDTRSGWRRSLDEWFEAVKQCHHGIEHCATRLADVVKVELGEWAPVSVIEADLATASYRAGMAAGGLDMDWYDWLLERVNHWPDQVRRDYQLDLMTLEPNYRATVESLPAYWR